MAGGIALEHRRQIGAHRRADLRIGGHRLFEGLAHHQRAQDPRRPACGQVIGQRIFQPVMLEDGGMDEAGQRGLALRHGFGLGAQAAPRPDRSSPVFRA